MYVFESLTGLRSVMDRLYAENPLTGDERRDLANKMHALISAATKVRPPPPIDEKTMNLFYTPG